MQQKEPAAAQPGGERLDYGQRGSHCDRGVERVAALREDLLARGGGEWMRGGDRLLGRLRGDRQKAAAKPRAR